MASFVVAAPHSSSVLISGHTLRQWLLGNMVLHGELLTCWPSPPAEPVRARHPLHPAWPAAGRVTARTGRGAGHAHQLLLALSDLQQGRGAVMHAWQTGPWQGSKGRCMLTRPPLHHRHMLQGHAFHGVQQHLHKETWR